MKSFTLALSFCFVGLITLHAELNTPHISVVGEAKKVVEPDELHWSLLVQNRGKSVEETASSHSKDVTALLNWLKEQGLEEQELKTTGMRLQENWSYRNNGRVRDGYIAVTQINFKATDFKSYEHFWKQLATYKNVSIQNVRFAVSNRAPLVKELKVEALKNARNKAKTLAAALDSKIGSPLIISELEINHMRQPQVMMARNEAMEESADGGSSISAGSETIHAQIKAVFSLEQ